MDVLYEKTFGRAERLPGYARVLLDSYPITSHDVLLIVSNSGRNALPVEMAIEARERGIATIAITSLEHSRAVGARHASGLRLFEACDVVIDNCGVAGDAALELDGIGEPVRVGPTSTRSGGVHRERDRGGGGGATAGAQHSPAGAEQHEPGRGRRRQPAPARPL